MKAPGPDDPPGDESAPAGSSETPAAPPTAPPAVSATAVGVASTEKVWFAQGLRGIACLIVVWEHLAYDYLAAPDLVRLIIFTPPDLGLGVRPPGWQTAFYQWLTSLHIAPGQFGVSLFFLISGFVIPFSLERHRLSGFFVRRFFRLYPTLWAGIAVTLAALAIQAHLVQNGFPVGKKAAGSSGLLVGVYMGQPWVDPVYWTLAIEELFYVIAAFTAWKGSLHRRAVVAAVGLGLAVTTIVVAPIETPVGSVPPYWYLRTHLARNACFVIFILIGVAFHQHYRGRWNTATSAAMGAGLLGAFAVSLAAGPFPGNQAGIYLGSGIAALVVFTPLYVWRDRVPRARALDALANISYPLYLIHTVVGWILLRALFHVAPNFWVSVPLALVICVAMAAAIHFLVEIPSNAIGRRIVSRPRFRRVPPPAPPATATAATVAGDGAAVAATGPPRREP